MGCGFSREAYLFAEVLQDALGFAWGKFAVIAPDEERGDWGGGEVAFGVEGEELGHAGLSDTVERDDPGLSGFGEVRVTTEFVKNCTLSFFVETQRPVLPFPNPPSLPP